MLKNGLYFYSFLDHHNIYYNVVIEFRASIYRFLRNIMRIRCIRIIIRFGNYISIYRNLHIFVHYFSDSIFV